MLKRLYIDNVRCFTNFELRPDPVAALVGSNGSGKTTVFRILQSLQELLQVGQVAEQVFGGSRTHWETRPVQTIELDVVGANDVEYAYKLSIAYPADGKRCVIQDERLSANGLLVYRLSEGEVQLFSEQQSSRLATTFPIVPTRSFLPLLESRPDNQLIMGFRRWLDGIWLFSLRPQDVRATSDVEAAGLSRDASNFVSWYRTLAQEQPQVRDALRDDLLPIIPGLEDIRLLSAGQSTRLMAFDCSLSGKRFALGLNELSDGQRALVVLYTILHTLAGRASLLMFDEPDNFLAHAEIQPWLSGMREAVSSAAATLLVISHHPEVIDYLAPDQLLLLSRDEAGPARVRVPTFDRTSGMKASDVLQLEAR